MDEVATKIIDILKKHMKEPRDDISLSTALTDLKIESLDLAMIVFDIEDTFGIEIPYNANEEVEDFKTVGSVVDRVKALMAAGPSAASAKGLMAGRGGSRGAPAGASFGQGPRGTKS